MFWHLIRLDFLFDDCFFSVFFASSIVRKSKIVVSFNLSVVFARRRIVTATKIENEYRANEQFGRNSSFFCRFSTLHVYLCSLSLSSQSIRQEHVDSAIVMRSWLNYHACHKHTYVWHVNDSNAASNQTKFTIMLANSMEKKLVEFEHETNVTTTV